MHEVAATIWHIYVSHLTKTIISKRKLAKELYQNSSLCLKKKVILVLTLRTI